MHALYEQKLKAADDRLQAAHSSKATAEFLHNEFINQTEGERSKRQQQCPDTLRRVGACEKVVVQ